MSNVAELKAMHVNESGMIPVEHKVLVKPIEVEEKTKGGIILPQQTKEQEELQQIKAHVIDVGGCAFHELSEAKGEFVPWPGNGVPKPGDRIIMAKYAGNLVTGSDGEKYRLINDKEIVAVLIAE